MSLIIPSTAITIFAMADKNIQEKKEIINKQTNASNFDNFDKEETLQKIITLLLLKGTSSSKYSGSKADLNIVGVRVLLVYAMTYILSLIITSLIAQKYYNEEIKLKEDIRETIGSTLIGLATLGWNSISFNSNSNKNGK